MSWKKWVAVASLVVLIGGLLGALGVRPGEAAVGETHQMTIPAAAFIPTTGTAGYTNNGKDLTAAGGAANFTAPLAFPVDLEHVRITQLIFWARDNAIGSVCVYLYGAQPKTSSETLMTQKCSDAALPTDRRFATSQIWPRTANSSRGLYLWLSLPAGDYKFYGATIRWTEI